MEGALEGGRKERNRPFTDTRSSIAELHAGWFFSWRTPHSCAGNFSPLGMLTHCRPLFQS